MTWLRWLHRYVGAVIAALMLVLAITGGVLVFKNEIWRLQYPELSRPLPALGAAEHAAAFRAIDERFKDRLLMVRLPSGDTAAYHVFLEEGEALVDPVGHALIDQWAWHQRFTGILVELHFHLAAGRVGKNVVGVLGVIAGLMAITGVVLWWGVRRQFRWRSLRPAGTGRGHMLRLHRDLGTLSATFVLLFGLTGAAVVFGSASRAMFNAVLGGPSSSEPRPVISSAGSIAPPSEAMLIQAQSALPHAQLISWATPDAGSALHSFRFRAPGEVHPNGRSTVLLDGTTGRVVSARDATMAPRGERTANWMYPLHAAKIGGWAYQALAVVAALALSVICLSGLWGFIHWLRRATSTVH